MKNARALTPIHPVLVFWLGVLTGALVVGFVFLYQTLNNEDYRNAVLKYSSPTYKTSTSLLSPYTTTSTSSLSTTSLDGGYAIPTPQPSMPTPTPNMPTPTPN